MKVLLCLLIFCAVKCDDVSNNYYVIEMPDDEIQRDFKKPFQVYWNVPTTQCRSKNIEFKDLYEKYGIIQNDGDSFRGEKITIMYEPGSFPAIFKNETSGKYRFRNGGVPQEGNLEKHLAVFKSDMKDIVPNPDFSGIGIIDFESWRPIFRQNFGTLVPYKDVSFEIEKKLHWWWPRNWINNEATQRFESAARVFMQTTLSIAKQMRPKAQWGYYGFPHCFNMAGQNMMENCASNVVAENDLTYWMWSESTALYPSVYSSRNFSSNQLASLVRGRVREANRVRRYQTPVLPYYWFRYREGGYMTEEDLNVVLQSFFKSNASGFIIWGSSKDVNTLNKCKSLHTYVENILGPTIAKYIKKINTANDVVIDTPLAIFENDTLNSDSDNVTVNKTNVSANTENNTIEYLRNGAIDPEYVWVPPQNYSQDISKNVEEELLRKGYNKSEESILETKTFNSSVVVDMILDILIKADNYNDMENNKQTTRYTQNDTKTTTLINSTDLTTVSNMRTRNSLSSLPTKDPLSFLNPTIEETKDEFDKIPFNNQLSKNTAGEEELVTDASLYKWFSVKPSPESFYFSPTVEMLSNNSEIKEFNASNNNISKRINQETEHDSIKANSTDENFIINIFDALLKKYNQQDEYDETKSEYSEGKLSIPESTTDVSEVTDLSNKYDSDIFDTESDEFLSANYDYSTENSNVNTLESQEGTVDIDQSTEISLPPIKEDYLSLNIPTTEDSIVNKETISFNEYFDDFTMNRTEYNSESTTQYDKNTDFDNNDDNFILAFNLSPSNESSDINMNDNTKNILTTEESKIETQTDEISAKESINYDFFMKDNEIKRINNEEIDLFSTDSTTDQVVTYVYYP